MKLYEPANFTLQNSTALIKVDKLGGAITNFSLKNKKINPLSFRLELKNQISRSCFYKGHFLGLGRWADPSVKEGEAGLSKHGDLVNADWEGVASGNSCTMATSSKLEGFDIERTITLHPDSSCFHVKEKIKNINPLSRMYNMVQHATIASPFLNKNTIINCSATKGFNALAEYAGEELFQWPNVSENRHTITNLECPLNAHSAVHSFISHPEQPWGWITAYSPEHALLLGYIWNRKDYPWINFWMQESENNIIYRGLEFNTTGIHKTFREILEKNLIQVLGEKTYSFIDPQEEHTRQYIAFLCEAPADFKGVETIAFKNNELILKERDSGRIISIEHSFTL